MQGVVWTSTSLKVSLTKNIFFFLSSFPQGVQWVQLSGPAIEFCRFCRPGLFPGNASLAIVTAQEIGALSCITIMFSLFSNCNIWPLNVYNWSCRHQFFVWPFLIAVGEKRGFSKLSPARKLHLRNGPPTFQKVIRCCHFRSQLRNLPSCFSLAARYWIMMFG